MIVIRIASLIVVTLLGAGSLSAYKVAFTQSGSAATNRYYYWVSTTTEADQIAVLSAAQPLTGGTKCPSSTLGSDASGTVVLVQCSSSSASGFASKLTGLGYAIVAGQFTTFNASQTPAMSLSSAASTPSLTVTASAGLAWRATANTAWLSVTNSAGAFTCSVTTNSSAQSRTAVVSITVPSGVAQINVTQSAGTASYSFASPGATVGVAEGSGQAELIVSLSDGPWTATSNQSWLTVSPSAGEGSTTLTYAYTFNTTPATRTATITVKNVAFKVTQQAGKIILTPSSVQVPQAGGSGALSIAATPADNPWIATTSAGWLTVRPPSGTGSATITYSFEPNPNTGSRSATINVNGVGVSVSQPGVSVSFSPSTVSVAGAGATGNVSMAIGGTNTPWSATGGAAWLSLSPRTGTGGGPLSYTAALNDSLKARSTSVNINGASLTFNQAGLPGTVKINPVSAIAPASGSSGVISAVASPSDYTTWTVTGLPSWLTLSFASGRITWNTVGNPTSLNRSATLNIGGQTFSLIQAGTKATNPLVAGVTSSASYVAGTVAPGQLVTIFGLTLGPDEPAGPTFNANGLVSTTNSQTQVFFDAISAPILLAYTGQATVQVPYQLAGKTSTSLTVQYKGVSSPAVPLTVGPAAFALYTADASGTGQAAALNQDISLNSAANPNPRGSVIVLYGTGEGQTTPAGIEGSISPLSPPWITPALPVLVTIGGLPAVVEFAGETPGQISGLFQVNARIPDSAPSGPAIPIAVKIGNSTSQSGVVIAVK